MKIVATLLFAIAALLWFCMAAPGYLLGFLVGPFLSGFVGGMNRQHKSFMGFAAAWKKTERRP